jgi:hypothetical protein
MRTGKRFEIDANAMPPVMSTSRSGVGRPLLAANALHAETGLTFVDMAADSRRSVSRPRARMRRP